MHWRNSKWTLQNPSSPNANYCRTIISVSLNVGRRNMLACRIQTILPHWVSCHTSSTYLLYDEMIIKLQLIKFLRTSWILFVVLTPHKWRRCIEHIVETFFELKMHILTHALFVIFTINQITVDENLLSRRRNVGLDLRCAERIVKLFFSA